MRVNKINMSLDRENGAPHRTTERDEEIKKKIKLTISRWLFYKRALENYDFAGEPELKQDFIKRLNEISIELNKLLKRFPQYTGLIEEVKNEFDHPVSPYKPEDFVQQNTPQPPTEDPRQPCPRCGRKHYHNENCHESEYP